MQETTPLKLPHSPTHGETFEVTIESLSLEGRGQASVPAVVGPQEEPKDYTFEVRKTVPGDRVIAEVESRKKRTVTARISEMLEASKMRTEPRCRHFGRRELPGEGCGGCALQSMSYRHQLANKERTIKKLMQAQGLDPGLVMPILGQDEPWYYRNKMEFSFGDTAEREFALGLYPKGYRYEIVKLDECFLQSEFVSELLPRVRKWAKARGLEPYQHNSGFLRTLTVREGKRTGQRMVELTTTHDEQALMDGEQVPASEIADAFCEFVLEASRDLGAELTSVYWTQQRAQRGEPTRFFEHNIFGEPLLVEEMHLPDDQVLSFEIHPRAFFQPNTLQAEVLYAQVLEKTGLLEGSDKKTRSRVLDLYCGTGTIGLCMAPYAEKVVGIEMQPDAVENARQNARLNGIDNISFFTGDVAKVLDQDEFRAEAGQIDLVVVDPPRAGLHAQAREHLKTIDAQRLVYVSCSPKALARDLAELADFGYAIEVIQPVDMFPHTYHVENVALLVKQRRSGGAE